MIVAYCTHAWCTEDAMETEDVYDVLQPTSPVEKDAPAKRIYIRVVIPDISMTVKL